MAVAKSARVRDKRNVGPHAEWLELELEEPLGFVGGQYIIVDSGRVQPSGKAAKRAYSIITSDAEQARVELVVRRIPGGLCSDYMHGLAPGDTLRFSGPWSKVVPPLDASGPTLVLATDTGVTAALGLIGGARAARLLPELSLLWLRTGPDDFVSDDFVRERLPAGLARCEFWDFLPVHDPGRVPRAAALVAEFLGSARLAHAFASGDGVVNYGLMEALAARGARVGRDTVESFFNMPTTKS